MRLFSFGPLAALVSLALFALAGPASAQGCYGGGVQQVIGGGCGGCYGGSAQFMAQPVYRQQVQAVFADTAPACDSCAQSFTAPQAVYAQSFTAPQAVYVQPVRAAFVQPVYRQPLTGGVCNGGAAFRAQAITGGGYGYGGMAFVGAGFRTGGGVGFVRAQPFRAQAIVGGGYGGAALVGPGLGGASTNINASGRARVVVDNRGGGGTAAFTARRGLFGRFR